MRTAAAIVALLCFSASAGAQQVQNSEQTAFGKAKCIFDAMTTAGKAFTPLSLATNSGALTKEIQDRAGRELDEFARLSEVGVKSCLNENEVYSIGRYSYWEDIAFAVGSPCKLRKTRALSFHRTPNNNDGDIVNGAVRWTSVNNGLDKHPFFIGQAEARKEHRALSNRNDVCSLIIREFGSSGTVFPGLVQSTK